MIPINDVNDVNDFNDVNDVLHSEYNPFTGYDIKDIERTLELDVGKKRTMSFIIVRTLFFQETDSKIPRRPREVQPFLVRAGAGGWFLAFQEISSKEGATCEVSIDLFPPIHLSQLSKTCGGFQNFQILICLRYELCFV